MAIVTVNKPNEGQQWANATSNFLSSLMAVKGFKDQQETQDVKDNFMQAQTDALKTQTDQSEDMFELNKKVAEQEYNNLVTAGELTDAQVEEQKRVTKLYKSMNPELKEQIRLENQSMRTDQTVKKLNTIINQASMQNQQAKLKHSQIQTTVKNFENLNNDVDAQIEVLQEQLNSMPADNIEDKNKSVKDLMALRQVKADTYRKQGEFLNKITPGAGDVFMENAQTVLNRTVDSIKRSYTDAEKYDIDNVMDLIKGDSVTNESGGNILQKLFSKGGSALGGLLGDVEYRDEAAEDAKSIFGGILSGAAQGSDLLSSALGPGINSMMNYISGEMGLSPTIKVTTDKGLTSFEQTRMLPISQVIELAEEGGNQVEIDSAYAPVIQKYIDRIPKDHENYDRVMKALKNIKGYNSGN